MMLRYILKRLLLMIPTLLGIMVLNFLIIQAAPGGPVERTIAMIKGQDIAATSRFGGSTSSEASTGQAAPKLSTIQQTGESQYLGAQGLDPDMIATIEKLYGFDKPPVTRFFLMLKQYIQFDFGESFYQSQSVIDLILAKLPVSISLGLWTTLFIYLISIPLGIKKAYRDGDAFDFWTSMGVIIGYAIPGFLFAVLLVVLFAGGSFLTIFPLRGLVSENWQDLNLVMKILDYLWHIALPVLAMVLSGFAGLTLLTKNSFIEEIHKNYVMTARAKGLTERRVLYGHVFRNAMLIVVAGFPSAFVGIFFTGSVLIETIFSLDGLGLLGFEAAINRDYPIMFGTLFVFTLLGLIMNLIGDLTYRLIDPRIDFERRETV